MIGRGTGSPTQSHSLLNLFLLLEGSTVLRYFMQSHGSQSVTEDGKLMAIISLHLDFHLSHKVKCDLLISFVECCYSKNLK